MLNKTVTLISFLPLAICFINCSNAEDDSKATDPINILFITADDLNYNSVGCYGCTIPNITPNIDRLAEQGMLFEHGFVNIAVCQPCRQSIMTGQYPHRNGAPGFDPIAPDVPTLQEQLNKAGYLNGILGKEKHLKPMERYCWDLCITEGELASGIGIGRDPERYYRYASEFIARAKKENKPFFLMANSHDPHRPFAGSDQEMRAWGADLPKFTRKILPDDVTVPGFLFDLPEVRLEMAEYYTSVHRCDQTVGAVLKALEDGGASKNTIVMFISDNGMSVPFAKSNCYLNSNKTPWIVRWPDHIKPGSVDRTHFISGIDYMPTILDVLNLPQVPGMDGSSFLPILCGEEQKHRTAVFTEYNKIFAGTKFPMRCVQTDRYGYIVNFWADGKFRIRGEAMSGRTFSAMNQAASTDENLAKRLDLYIYRTPEELYDFETDPDGLVNLIDDPNLRHEKERLKKLLHAEMRRSQDPLLDEFESRFMR